MLIERDLIRDISPDDEMFSDSGAYFMQGRTALECIERVLDAEPRRILDLPCGHGRVTRFLRRRFPDAEIVACDIVKGGVDFCAETFGAVPVHASKDPRELTIDGTFDLIWCGSLLTHLHPDRWDDFMDLFESLLAKGGTLVLTLHGRQVARRVRTGWKLLGLDDEGRARLLANYRSGFAYEDYPYQSGFGFCLSRGWWAMRHLERDRLRLVSFSEAGWAGFQDVYAARATHQPRPRAR